MSKIERIGRHKVKHGNLLDGIEDLMGDDVAELGYSDPPWGVGNLKYWNTMNGKMNKGKLGHDQKACEPYDVPSYENFIDFFYATCFRYVRNVLIVECGIQWRELLIDKAAEHGFKYHHGTCQPLYRSGSELLPNDLHLFSKDGQIDVPGNYFEVCESLRGASLPKAAVEPFAKRGGIVLDPCCGMGYTAKAAIYHSMNFRGNELNEHRLNKTKKFLRGTLGKARKAVSSFF